MLEKLLLLLEELNVNVQHIRDTQLQETKYLRNIGDVATYVKRSAKLGSIKIKKSYI